MSTVRDNLMTREGYTPYCGNMDKCSTMPRTSWTGEQFKCGCCGWVSAFPDDFIAEYKAKWGKGSNPTVTIGGFDLPVRICTSQLPDIRIDLAEPGSDRTVVTLHGGDEDEMAEVADGLRERGVQVVVLVGCHGRGALQYTGLSHYGLLPSVELVEPQFALPKNGRQDRLRGLRDRWGRLKR